MDETSVPMNQAIAEVTEQKTKEDKYQYRMMRSGARHDSQIIAPHYPAAMIFVPNTGGISHNPTEATTSPDLVEGVRLLTDILYELAYK